jgi:hypothetical protein
MDIKVQDKPGSIAGLLPPELLRGISGYFMIVTA